MPRKNSPKSTGRASNVFRDLGFSPEQSGHLLVRADLMVELQKRIASRRLKQADAAEILGVSQPRVSNLLQGRLDLFSTDMLIDMLARFGVKVRVVMKSSRRFACRLNIVVDCGAGRRTLRNATAYTRRPSSC